MNQKAFVVSLAVFFFTIISWFCIVGTTCWGHFYWGFNSPSHHQATIPKGQGLTSFLSVIQPGWVDGHFYYYISSDPFALKPESDQVDIPFYRYKRVGQPLLSNILAFCLGKKEVTPFLFSMVPILLATLSTYFLVLLFMELGIGWVYALIWPLFLSVQETLRLGIMDGTAEALCVLALIAFYKKRLFFYIACMSFAVLSRESFLLVPIACLFFTKEKRKFLVLPILVGVLWQGYLFFRFGNAFKGTEALVNLPGLGILEALASLSTKQGFSLIVAGASLFLFLIVTSIALFFFIRAWKQAEEESLKGIFGGLILMTLLPLAFTYVIFGSIYYYMRFLGITLAFLPLGFYFSEKKKPPFLLSSLLFTCLFYSLSLQIVTAHKRSIQAPLCYPPAQFIDSGEVVLRRESLTSLHEYAGTLEITKKLVQPFNELPFKSLFCPLYFVYELNVTNSSQESWCSQIVSTIEQEIPSIEDRYIDGAVFLMTEWLSWPDKAVIKRGPRCCIPKVESGKTVHASVITVPPKQQGLYLLRIFLEQKGVGPFYERSNQGYIENFVKI